VEVGEHFVGAGEQGQRLGLRDRVDCLDARASLYDQRIQFVDTLARYALDRLALQSAVGDLGSDDLQETMRLLASIADSNR
jgi:outer membrane protein